MSAPAFGKRLNRIAGREIIRPAPPLTTGQKVAKATRRFVLECLAYAAIYLAGAIWITLRYGK